MNSSTDKCKLLWTIAKSLAIVIPSAIVGYKVLMLPFSFETNISDLLFILLALFSIGLSALFYFRATDTSNRFYDNTYKFTKDIAELLVRIESGFGERLRHLDESYASMRDNISRQPLQGELQEAKKDVKAEANEVAKIIKERDQLIRDMADRANLQEKEREAFIDQLKRKNEELALRSDELKHLRYRLLRASEPRLERVEGLEIPVELGKYVASEVLRQLDPNLISGSPIVAIRRQFDRISGSLSPVFIQEMKKYGYVGHDEKLTSTGAMAMRKIARRIALGG